MLRRDHIRSDEELIEDAARLTRIFCSKYFVSATWTERQDIEQEVVLRLLKARETFDPSKSNWTTYSWLQARGAILDYLGKIIPYRDAEVSVDEFYASTYDDYSYLDREDLLKRLTPRYRKLLCLLEYGMKSHEIAKLLGVSTRAVYLLTTNLRAVLRYENST